MAMDRGKFACKIADLPSQLIKPMLVDDVVQLQLRSDCRIGCRQDMNKANGL